MRGKRGIGPAPLRSYERHGAGPFPYSDDTCRGRVGHRGGEAAGMIRQQPPHPAVSRRERQRHTAHEHIGKVHEPDPLRAVRVHPQVHVAGQRSGRVRTGRRARIPGPARVRGQRVGPYESRSVCRNVCRFRVPDDQGHPVVRAVTTRHRTRWCRAEAHGGPSGIRFRDREPVAHSPTPLPAEICHRVSAGGSGSGAMYGGRAGSPSPSIR